MMKKLLVLFAMLPLVTLADLVPRQMTLKDDGLFLFAFERFLETASPRFGLTWVDVAVVAIGSAILLFLIARILMALEFSFWKILLLWAFPLGTCSIGILWIIGFAYDCRESLALFWWSLFGGVFAAALHSLISKDTPRWFCRYCSLFHPLVGLLGDGAGHRGNVRGESGADACGSGAVRVWRRGRSPRPTIEKRGACVGNALFHLSSGKTVLDAREKMGGPIGLFISAGVLGFFMEMAYV